MLALPLGTPLINSYLHHAYQTSILGTCADRTLPWILSNHIQLFYDGNEGLPIQFYMPDDTGYTWSITSPFIERQMVKKHVLTMTNTNIIEFVIAALENEYYVMTYINEKHIPNKGSYGNTDFSHMFLIHGYDSGSQSILHTGYNNEIYGTMSVPFTAFEQAYTDNPVYPFHTHDRIFLYKINDNFHYRFNPAIVLEQLQDLLYSKKDKRLDDDPGYLFGYDVYDNMLRIVEKNLITENKINIIPFLLLAEHKKLMSLRLKYLEDLGLVSKDRNHPQLFRELEQRCYILRNKAIKYNLSKQNRVIENVGGILQKIKNEEMNAIHEVISELQTKITGGD